MLPQNLTLNMITTNQRCNHTSKLLTADKCYIDVPPLLYFTRIFIVPIKELFHYKKKIIAPRNTTCVSTFIYFFSHFRFDERYSQLKLLKNRMLANNLSSSSELFHTALYYSSLNSSFIAYIKKNVKDIRKWTPMYIIIHCYIYYAYPFHLIKVCLVKY